MAPGLFRREGSSAVVIARDGNTAAGAHSPQHHAGAGSVSEALIIALLILANGVFAGAEIAVVALRKTRIEELAEEGNGGARAVLALRREPERFLATVQVGITVISAGA